MPPRPEPSRPLSVINRWPRITGCGALGVVLLSALADQHAAAPAYALALFLGFLWPHLAYALTLGTDKADRVEYRNLHLDALLAGLAAGATHYEPISTFACVLTVLLNAMVVGGPYLALRAALTAAAGALPFLVGQAYDPPVASPRTMLLAALEVGMHALTLTFVAYLSVVKVREQRRLLHVQKQQIEALVGKLGKYLSPQIYAEIFEGRADVKVGAGRKFLTVLFADLVGFTPRVEALAPDELSRFLNAHLDRMTRIALAHGGTVDKYIGDSIMVFFGDPTSRGRAADARACVAMALAMQAACAERGADTRMRIGIHSGLATVGNFGSERRLEYTAIGHTVNVASRLEGRADVGDILISRATAELLGDTYALKPRGEVELKGVRDRLAAYVVLGKSGA